MCSKSTTWKGAHSLTDLMLPLYLHVNKKFDDDDDDDDDGDEVEKGP